MSENNAASAVNPHPFDLIDDLQLAALLGVSRSWIRLRCAESHPQRIPHIRVSNKVVRFRLADVERWLESHSSVEVR